MCFPANFVKSFKKGFFSEHLRATASDLICLEHTFKQNMIENGNVHITRRKEIMVSSHAHKPNPAVSGEKRENPSVLKKQGNSFTKANLECLMFNQFIY